MATTQTQADLVKGSALNLWYNGNVIAWATNHTFNSTVNLNEVNCKDAGDYPLQIATNITWNISCEYLYAEASTDLILQLYKAKTPIQITYAEVSNYSTADEQGVIGKEKTWSMGDIIAQGNVIINDLTINSNAGEQASFSCTMTGSGSFTSSIDSGTQGVQGT